MKIPQKFTLFAEKWTVVESGSWLDCRNANGNCNYEKHVISLQPADNQDGLTMAGIEHTFLHELLHAIAHTANVELGEQDIDVMSGLLHQAIETMEVEI